MNFDGFNCRTASSTIDNDIDVSFEVKMYAETSFRLRNKDLRHAFRFSKNIAPTVLELLSLMTSMINMHSKTISRPERFVTKLARKT